MNLATTYLGLELDNPIIAGASAMTGSTGLAKRIEDAGAAALVTQSLFEEQLQLQRFHEDEEAAAASSRHPEMTTVFPDVGENDAQEHLEWLRNLKETLGIPVVGSLNAVRPESWIGYAQKMAQTGVDALELNFYSGSRATARAAADIENEQKQIVREICTKIDLPVSVKLSVFYTNPEQVVRELVDAGAAGVVLFNAFFHPDFDIETEGNVLPRSLSRPETIRLRLRFAGLLYAETNASVCVSGGVLDGTGVVKALLAGADAVQMVSALYRDKPECVGKALEDVSAWMQKKGYESLADFRGKLSRKHNPDRWTYTRMQYARALLRTDPLAPPDHALRST